jgi:hypothetical protein
MQNKTSKTRYHIIRLQVKQSGEFVAISEKLPAHLKVCTGYVARHTKGVKSTRDMNELGLLSLEFNHRKGHFVNDVVGFEYKLGSLPAYQTLNIPLEKGQLLTGYYMDTKQFDLGSFNPYTISIYLRCDTHPKNE